MCTEATYDLFHNTLLVNQRGMVSSVNPTTAPFQDRPDAEATKQRKEFN
jgi:hypothetical protein